MMSLNLENGRLDRMAAIILASVVWAVEAQFNMWPSVNSTQLASAMGFSAHCLNAMNQTVTCDPDLFRMTGQIDLYYWVQDNLTDLCTASCLQSASDWLNGVYDACGGQMITIDSKMVPTESVAIRYSDGIGLACLTDIQLSITSSYNQTPEADPSTSTSQISLNDTSTPQVNASSSANSASPMKVNNSTFNYCFLEAQNWVGVDVIAPDCSLDPKNTICTDPDATSRLANLYNITILCSDCFLSVMWWRINSPFLPDADESDYLIDQYQDITDICNVTMPPSLIRALPSYQDAPLPNYLTPGTDPNANTTASNNTGCSGQVITASKGKRDEVQLAERDPEFVEFEDDYSGYARIKRASVGSCDTLSQAHGVATGDLQSISGNDDCSFNTSSICVPLKCEVARVSNNQSCVSITSSLSTSSMNVTIALFLQWNPNIIGLCDNLATGQYICTGPPGGGYTLPPPIRGTNTNAGGQQRGGQGSGTNPDGPSGPDGPNPNSTASAPTQPGIAKDCSSFAYAGAGDTCYAISQRFHITLAQLTAWNPVLGNPDGHNCSTAFLAGYDYCVGVSAVSTTTHNSNRASPTTTSSAIPTQSGLVSNCNRLVVAKKGGTCVQFATDNDITPAQLYKWNPILGKDGVNCPLKFQAGEGYCVGVGT